MNGRTGQLIHVGCEKTRRKRMHRLYVGYLLHSQIGQTQLLIKLIISVCQGISVSCLLRTDGAWKKSESDSAALS